MIWVAGWRYGIIPTVPYEQQKIYRQIILFQRIYYLSISLTGLPCHREPSIVLMSMVLIILLMFPCRQGTRPRPLMSWPSAVRCGRRPSPASTIGSCSRPGTRTPSAPMCPGPWPTWRTGPSYSS